MSRNWRQSWTVSASQISPHLHLSNSLPHSAHTGNLYLSNLNNRLEDNFSQITQKLPNFAQFLIKNPNISMPMPPPPLTQFPFHQQGLHAESSDGELEAKTGSYHSTHTTGLALMFYLERGGARQLFIKGHQTWSCGASWWVWMSVFTDSVLILCLIVYTRHLLELFLPEWYWKECKQNCS